MQILLRELAAKFNYVLRKTLDRFLATCAYSVLQNMDIIATVESVKLTLEFEREHFKNVPDFKTREKLFSYCFNKNIPDGLCLEFGVYKGDSINLLAKLQRERHFFGFDSFVGLPETWTMGSRSGAFDTGGRLPKVRGNVTLIKGFFDQTLPLFVKDHAGEKVAFIHNDSDLYSSTVTILEGLREMIVTGTIIVFDEYYNYPGWVEHEYKAFMEFTERHQIEFCYIGYIRKGTQVAVEIL
ncbi:MAG: class I SAM-dependent methyltransferase [Syntrophales bacterium]|nr:class I SAM-dependent methyltransferase [Syntrophales bacterium]